MMHWAVPLAGALAVIFTALMVFQRSLYKGAICLLVVLLQAAVIFYFSGAPLLAFLQVMIYAGAVMVLIVVAVMAAPFSPAEPSWNRLSLPWPLAVAGLLLPVIEAGWLFYKSGGDYSPVLPVSAPSSQALGAILFGPYAAATEAVTLLMLLSALAVVGKRERPT